MPKSACYGDHVRRRDRATTESAYNAAVGALPVGASGLVHRVDAVPAQQRRMAELGLRPGVVVTVLGRTAGGGRLLGVGTDRIALDGATAGRVVVAATP